MDHLDGLEGPIDVVLPWEHPGIVDEEQPPGVAFRVIGDDRGVTTHFRSIT